MPSLRPVGVMNSALNGYLTKAGAALSEARISKWTGLIFSSQGNKAFCYRYNLDMPGLILHVLA